MCIVYRRLQARAHLLQARKVFIMRLIHFNDHVYHLPTEKAQARTFPRLQEASSYLGRAPHRQEPPPQGPLQAYRLRMLAQNKRIARRDFAPLLASRLFFHSAHFVLRAFFDTPRAQAAVSVSKKVSKSAVARNTIRRRTYAAIADNLPKKGLFLFIAKPGSASVRGETLVAEVKELLKAAESRYNS